VSRKHHVGQFEVENFFPDCDALNIWTVGAGACMLSVTISRQEDQRVEVQVQDDNASAAKVFILGSGQTRDPHAFDEPECEHEPDWATAAPDASEPGAFNVTCKLCGELAPFVVSKRDVCWG
jgi:hypothetical protein